MIVVDVAFVVMMVTAASLALGSGAFTGAFGLALTCQTEQHPPRESIYCAEAPTNYSETKSYGHLRGAIGGMMVCALPGWGNALVRGKALSEQFTYDRAMDRRRDEEPSHYRLFPNYLRLRPAGYSHPSTAPRTTHRRGLTTGSQASTPCRGSQGPRSHHTRPNPEQSFARGRLRSGEVDWLGFLASPRAPRGGNLADTHTSHMDRGRPAPLHGVVRACRPRARFHWVAIICLWQTSLPGAIGPSPVPGPLLAIGLPNGRGYARDMTKQLYGHRTYKDIN